MRESITSPLRLSEVIVRPGVYTNSKRLNVAGFKIATLDTVPEQYRKVEELNMKGNLLDKLGEIGQFAGLRVLDVSNNKVKNHLNLDHRSKRVAQIDDIEKPRGSTCRREPVFTDQADQ
jgi:Leucine-rich repeat (LRR) protein